MKNILLVVNGILVILVVLLFYRVNKSDQKISEMTTFLDRKDSLLMSEHNSNKSNEIEKIDATHIKADTDWDNLNQHPYKLIKIEEILFNPKKYNLTSPLFIRYYCTKDTINYSFFEFNQEKEIWENKNFKKIKGSITSIKIIEAGEDPKTAKDIRNRN